MLRARPVAEESGVVLGGHVSLVACEVIARIFLAQLTHDPVSRDLRDHRCGRDTCGHPVALPDCQPGHPDPGDREPVGEYVGWRDIQLRECPPHPGDVAYVESDTIDLGGGNDHY